MGVVTTKMVVTTQGGVVTTPNTHFFHVFWGYNLTTPLLRPFSGRRILFKCPLHTARCDARCDFEVCLRPRCCHAWTLRPRRHLEPQQRSPGLWQGRQGGHRTRAIARAPTCPVRMCAPAHRGGDSVLANALRTQALGKAADLKPFGKAAAHGEAKSRSALDNRLVMLPRAPPLRAPLP